MAKNKKNKKHEAPSAAAEVFETLDQSASRSEQFLEKNKNILIGIVAAFILIYGGYLAYDKMVKQPKEKEATNEMAYAKLYFEQDSLNLALNGDGKYFGFVDIISNYGGTKAANLSQYYAGVSYLKLGEYQNAIDYLEDFSSEDEILAAVATGAIGDAFAQLEQNEDAFDYYKKAAALRSNDFSTPLYLFKAATTAAALEDYGVAEDLFEQIKEEYPNSAQANGIEKYIERMHYADQN